MHESAANSHDADAPTVTHGAAEGDVLVLDDPLSFWGGVSEEAGHITDTHHPQYGEAIAGCILLMPTGRGSSSSSSVLAEVIRAGVGPAALLLRTADPILALGVMVAEALYDRTVPMAVLDEARYAQIARMSRARVVVAPDGVEAKALVP